MSPVALLREVSAAMVSQLAWASISAAVIVALAWAIARLRPSLAPATRSILWWAVSVAILLRLAPLPALTVEIPETSILARLLPAAPAPAALTRPAAAIVVSTPRTAAATARLASTSADPIAAIAAASYPIERPQAAGTGPRPIDWPIAVVLAWAGIAAWLLVRLAIETWRVRHVVASATPAPAFITDEADRLAAAFGLPAAPPVRISTAIDTPQVAGFRRPTLLLPETLAQTMTPRERAMTLCHELAHVRRLDLAFAWAPALAERLLFFHPGARLAAREYALAREAACDAEVLQRLGAAPRDYGRLLLRLGVAGRPAAMVAAQSSPSMRLLRRRLAMLNDQMPPHGRVPRGAWLAGAALVALAMPLSLVARQSDLPPIPPVPPAAAAPAVPPVPPHAGIAAVPPAPPRPAIAALPPLESAPPLPPMSAVAAHPAEVPLPPMPPEPAIAAVPPAPRDVDDLQAPPPPPPPPPPGSKPVAPPPPPPPPPPKDAFILLDVDGTSQFMGSWKDAEDAKRLRGSADGPFLYFRSGTATYTSRDRGLIERVRAELQEQRELGRRQGELGAKQGELGARQAALGAKQGDLGHKQGEFGAAMAAHAHEDGQLAALEAALAALKQDTKPLTPEIEAARKAVEHAIEALRVSGKIAGADSEEAARKLQAAAMTEIAGKQHDLGRLQAELGQKQAMLGAQQAELGKLQREAAERARARIKPMLEDAARSGLAQPVK